MKLFFSLFIEERATVSCLHISKIFPKTLSESFFSLFIFVVLEEDMEFVEKLVEIPVDSASVFIQYWEVLHAPVKNRDENRLAFEASYFICAELNTLSFCQYNTSSLFTVHMVRQHKFQGIPFETMPITFPCRVQGNVKNFSNTLKD
jgi:hypothetical protein